ncbi:uncharacterized protein LOC120104941 [Phoenix dactylifera]|uniref:Uncharacterized protein LOC120104941 n=1 Tax=Phoenix dactylifera TaxID=42345 RepID=A0A8B8ZHR1_PHODC|nr:uncharacterized protein LOC120104941 [Phoenix dactylifera]
MKTAFLLIMVLLATVAANAASMAIHEASSIPASLGKRLRSFLGRTGGIWNSVSIGVEGGSEVDSSKMRAKVGDKGGRHVGSTSSSCMTLEYCKKNKVICTKKCSKRHGSVVEKKHIPKKCTIKCKKCIPDC